MTDQIKMRTAADIWSDESGDDYDTDEELAKVTSSTTSRLKKKGEVAAPLDPEEEKLKMKKKMERAAEKKRKKEEKAARKAQRKKEKRLKREQRKKAESETGQPKDKKAGYESGDSYDSGDNLVRNVDDDNFLDLDDDDEDLLKEYNEDQNFNDERGVGSSKAKKGKKRSAGGGEKLSGARASDMDNPVMQAMSRMKRQKVKEKSVEELEQSAIEFVTLMDTIADTDEKSNSEGKPGVEKLKMMRRVTDTMANTQLMRPLLDYDVLKRVYRWIKPVKGKLGSVTIRKELLTAVGKMTGENGVSPGDLKRSNLGKMTMALYNHPAETKEMKLLLRKLIDQWSRPIFRKSGNYRDLEDAEQERRMVGFRPKAMGVSKAGGKTGGKGNENVKNSGEVGNVLTSGMRKANKEGEIKSARVSIPFSKGFSYTVRPGDKIVNETEIYMAGTRVKQGGTAEKLSKIMMEKAKPTVKNQRSQNISVEGRAVKN